MFPLQDNDEKFSVHLDGKSIDVLQSKDPDGYWHVAFDLSPQSTHAISISGFGKQEHSLLPTINFGSSNSSEGQQQLLPVANFRNYLLVIIPVTAVIISIVIWKKKTD
jgi:hypothetical protein